MVSGLIGRGIREKPHRARRESCDAAAGVTGARAVARSPPQPRSARAAASRRRRLPRARARVDRGVAGDVDDDLVGRSSRTRSAGFAGHLFDSSEGVLARRYQPHRPITNRPPATYRDSTIASQPKPRNKNKSRKTVSLTPAETRVLALLTTYQTLAGIGNQLGISRPTVKTHVQNIYKKLGATKRAEAVKLAESAGLLPDSAALMGGEDLGIALSQTRALHDPRKPGGQVEIERQMDEPDCSSVERGRARR